MSTATIRVNGRRSSEPADTFGRTAILFSRAYHWHPGKNGVLSLASGPSAGTLAEALGGDPVTLGQVSRKERCGCDPEFSVAIQPDVLETAVDGRELGADVVTVHA